MKNILYFTLMFCLSFSCSEGDEPNTEDDKKEEPGETPTATTIRFESTDVDCGLTDGYSNQQHTLPQLIHLNLDKCNGETYRPTLTLTFEQGETIKPGTYTIVSSGAPGAGEFVVNAVQYNFTSWTGTAGSVVVTENAEDATKIDIELKSITMANETSDDPNNPATDTLTGYIIKI